MGLTRAYETGETDEPLTARPYEIKEQLALPYQVEINEWIAKQMKLAEKRKRAIAILAGGATRQKPLVVFERARNSMSQHVICNASLITREYTSGVPTLEKRMR